MLVKIQTIFITSRNHFLNMNKIPLQASCESSLFVSTAQAVDSTRKAIDTVQRYRLSGAMT